MKNELGPSWILRIFLSRGIAASATARKCAASGLSTVIMAASCWAGMSMDDLVAPGATVEPVASGFIFTEGPAWSPDGFLLFTDLDGNCIVKLLADGTTELFLSPSGGANGLAFDAHGNLYVCQAGVDFQGNLYGGPRQVSRISKSGTLSVLADSFGSKKLNSPNDLALDAVGGIYFTDPRYYNTEDVQQDAKGVYYIPPGGGIRRLVSEITMPNGILISNDGTRLYVAEAGFTADQVGIRMYPILAPGELGPGQRIHSDPYVDGYGPDGMAIDEHGNLYGAFSSFTQGTTYGKNQILILDPDGQPIGGIPVPEGPSNCVFGGEDGKALYITAWGNVYRIGMQVRGAPLPSGPDPECPSYLRAERILVDQVRLTWENGERLPSGIDIFRDGALVAVNAPADPPEFIDRPDTRGVHAYRLEPNVPGNDCYDLTATADNTPPATLTARP
jgi:gluconolactonase